MEHADFADWHYRPSENPGCLAGLVILLGVAGTILFYLRAFAKV